MFLEVLALCGVVSLPAVIEVASGSVHAGWDIGRWFLPNWVWWWHVRVGAGWNPWIFGGFPTDADPQLGHGHPLGVLYWLLDPLVAITCEAALVPCVAAVGMWAYLRAIGCNRTGRLAGGLALGLGGVMVGHAPHLTIIRCVAVVPWALVAIEALSGPRLVAALGVSTALLILAGHPQVTAIAVVLIAGYALARAGGVRAVAARAAGMMLGLGLAAILWVPMIDLLAASTRAIVSPPFPNPTLVPATLGRLLAPFSEGGGVGPLAGPPERGVQCSLVECSGYPGMLLWLGVLTVAPYLARDPRGAFWLAAVIAGLVASSGAIPLPPGIRGPARYLLWWGVGSAALGGMALGALVQMPSFQPLRDRRVWGAFAVLAAALATAAMVNPRAPLALLMAAALLVASFVTIAAARRSKHPAVWVIPVLAVDLVAFAVTAQTAAVSPRDYDRTKDAVRRIATLRAEYRPDGARVLLLPTDLDLVWAGPFRQPIVQGYGPLIPRTVPLLLGERLRLGLDAVGQVDDASLAAPENRALDVLRVGLVVHDLTMPNPLGDALAARAMNDARWRRIPNAPSGLALYVNDGARPVGWLVDHVVVAPLDDALAIVRGRADRPFDPAREVLLTAPVPDMPDDIALREHDPPGVVELVDFADDTIRLRVMTDRPAVLVTSEVAYPGWHATVAGYEVPVLTANFGFRAVPVPAGRFDVVFRYAPTSRVIGRAVSALGLCVVVGLLGYDRRRRHDYLP